jgi:hypothetical protein
MSCQSPAKVQIFEISLLTSEVATVLLSASSAFTVLALSGPVGHAAKLVALGEGSVGESIAEGVGGDGRSP